MRNIPYVELDLQAVIMAGEFGTRLRSLTDHTPKSLLSVGGSPLMERTIETLQKAGIHRINVTTHFMPEKIIRHFGGGQRFGGELHYVSEEQPIRTARALRLINEVDEPFRFPSFTRYTVSRSTPRARSASISWPSRIIARSELRL